MKNDCRLIEDFLPIEAISAEASREKSVRKGHISTLHLWWARRPLVACRAAVYGALVPASRFVPAEGSEEERQAGRKAAESFLARLCKYPGDPRTIAEAQRHLLEAHAERLTAESGRAVSAEDIEAGRAPRPRVLDMFAGGGAIPLEALRLGCESHAVELNPVAHLVELCTVTYPQQFGAELADDVERWGRQVLDRTWEQVADLYPRLELASNGTARNTQGDLFRASSKKDRALSIVSHYWTRTAPCPNPTCGATVPLYRQTWLRNKSSGYVALRPIPDHAQKRVRFEVMEAASVKGLGFDPGIGIENSSTTCPFCHSAVDARYVRTYGDTQGFGQQLMCIIALNPNGRGKLYLAGESLAHGEEERQATADARAAALERELGPNSLDEVIPPTGNAGLATGKSYLYGIRTFRQAFTPRQRCVLLTMAREIRRCHAEMLAHGIGAERARATATYLGLLLSRLTDKFNSLARWNSVGEKIESLSSMKRFAMMWDYSELNVFGGGSGDALSILEMMLDVIRREAGKGLPSFCVRRSATDPYFENGFFDAVITDPPYYDNESYSELSDSFYIWLRSSIGFLYPEHFGGALTPKKKECVAAAYRQGGTREAARSFYETRLLEALKEAHRATKPTGLLAIVYAHKTTLGWATLVYALRTAGFEVAEAWPLDTERKGRVAHQEDAALASSIFLVARKRSEARSGSFEGSVRTDLERIVTERLDALWSQGISGADLVIACVGAGLRAFTRFPRVEYANGEEVPAEGFLAEVETVVLDRVLDKLSKLAGGDGGQQSLAGVDAATRFYILWRYTYRIAELDAGEAIVFANGTHVELDGQGSLSAGTRQLVEKRKATYRLRDFGERGDDEELGVPGEDGQPKPLIDILHRILWLLENRPAELRRYLQEAQPNREQLRLVAQALAGPALKGGELGDVSPTAELSALGKLTANWRSVMETDELPLGFR
ncbi:MAG: DUF1156 domain-containing protein [Deltaproteobacteria bacterium]|nr:DUF1156 domain-containing protein [Deltaproteobacteria bacterium]